MKRSFFFILCLLFLLCSTQSFGNIYSWKDENGVLHFSNNPPPNGAQPKDLTISEELQYDSEKDKQRMERVRTQSKPRDGVSEKKRATKKKVSPPGEVVMFSTARCGYCVRAKAFFAKHKVKYTNIDIDKSREGRKRYKELNGKGVPLILVGDRQIRGFNESALRKALGL